MKFKELHQSISSYVNISDTEYDSLLELCTYQKVQKHEILMQEGDICRYGIFVLSGCLSYYMINDAGNENIIDLGTKGWWMGDAESYWQEKPSTYYIKAVADSEVLLIDKLATEIAFKEIPNYLRYHFFMLLAYRDRTDHLLLESLHERADHKYHILMEARPEIFQLASLHDIASFLGITPQSLSRLRSNLH